jgi:hypothetical protein
VEAIMCEKLVLLLVWVVGVLVVGWLRSWRNGVRLARVNRELEFELKRREAIGRLAFMAKSLRLFGVPFEVYGNGSIAVKVEKPPAHVIVQYTDSESLEVTLYADRERVGSVSVPVAAPCASIQQAIQGLVDLASRSEGKHREFLDWIEQLRAWTVENSIKEAE